jgi:pyrroline-5-carboxylate reductase
LAVLGGELVPAEGAVVAVKPPDVEGACRALAGTEVHRALSIAAGIGLSDLEQWCGPGVAVLRAMPNIAALVGASATALAAGTTAAAADIEWAAGVLAAAGTVVRVPEHLLDAVTGVAGSGPAYIFLVAEALTEAGVLMGLSRAAAAELVAQTILGAGRLLTETADGPEALRAAVTSPGGTTAAALRQLEASGTRSAFIEAVVAAARRSRELASPATPPN